MKVIIILRFAVLGISILCLSMTTDPGCQELFLSKFGGKSSNENLRDFRSLFGLQVTERDDSGRATEVEARVMIGDPKAEVFLITHPEPDLACIRTALKAKHGEPIFFGRTNAVSHGMRYWFEVNGHRLVDPAANSFHYEYQSGKTPLLDSSIFWDFERPGSYVMKTNPIDLHTNHVLIAEADVEGIARNWQYGAVQGPANQRDTFRFIAESGLPHHIRELGYNAIKFLPVNASFPGHSWRFRYLEFGPYAPDPLYGSPDQFMAMIDSFHKAGMAVILDIVLSHFPLRNEHDPGFEQLGPGSAPGIDGHAALGYIHSEWGTIRYDFLNPYVRRFLVDSVITQLQQYHIDGIRIDDADGILQASVPPGSGHTFIRELVSTVRRYQPQTFVLAEAYYECARLTFPLSEGGFGVDFRENAALFDFFRNNLQRFTEALDMGNLFRALQESTRFGDSARLNYLTSHDDAANPRGGATGAHVASLLGGGPWRYVVAKTKVFGTLAVFSGGATLDLPQMRLLQSGSLNDDGINVNWGLEQQSGHSETLAFFRRLSDIVLEDQAFSQRNLPSKIIQHFDDTNKVLSLTRSLVKEGSIYYAVFNLSHLAMTEYRIGINPGTDLKVLLNSDDRQFGGTGKLRDHYEADIFRSDFIPWNGFIGSFTIPFLAPHSVMIFKTAVQ